MVQVKLDSAKITKAVKAAFRDTCFITHRNMVQVISDPNAFPLFPGQDIVDKGVLRANQQPPELSADGTKATFRNTAEYALYVYLGYRLRNGGTQPGRPWMAEGLKRTDFQKTFQLLLKAKL
jgi:hypothetical protein